MIDARPRPFDIPHDPLKGGTRFGWHFISTWKRCPTEWFNTYLRPTPDGIGYDQPPAVARDIGSATHAALEAWYRSEYDLDAAFTAIDAYAGTLRTTHPDVPEHAETVATEARMLMDRHHAHCGPSGLVPECQSWRVAHHPDTGEPLIEHLFQIPLGFQGYVFTCKTDVVLERVAAPGPLWPCDHKTCAPNRVGQQLRQYRIDGQLTGELWTIKQAWPGVAFGDALVNLVVKPDMYQPVRKGQPFGPRIAKRSNTPPRILEPFTRTATDLDVFRSSMVRTLDEIVRHVDEWHGLVSKGMTPDEAALIVFDSYPEGRVCAGEFYPCPFLEACCARELAGDVLATSMRTRIVTPPLERS